MLPRYLSFWYASMTYKSLCWWNHAALSNLCDLAMLGQCGGTSSCSMHVFMLLLMLAPFSSAQLSRDEKQQILDLHNNHRASVNAAGMKRLVRTNCISEWLPRFVCIQLLTTAEVKML